MTIPTKHVILFFLIAVLVVMILTYESYVKFLEDVIDKLTLSEIIELRKELFKKVFSPLIFIILSCTSIWHLCKKFSKNFWRKRDESDAKTNHGIGTLI